MPKASASLLAGSMVTTKVRLPWSALVIPKVAERVVFPTPPEPRQTQTRRVDKISDKAGVGVWFTNAVCEIFVKKSMFGT